MKILLDTHALLWWLLDDRRLSTAAREAIADPGNQVLVSSASGFEIATKHRLGKLGIPGLEPALLPNLLQEGRFAVLPITLEHALAAGALPGPHRDPFDRMLIAQSRVEQIPIVTQDPAFATYEVQILW